MEFRLQQKALNEFAGAVNVRRKRKICSFLGRGSSSHHGEASVGEAEAVVAEAMVAGGVGEPSVSQTVVSQTGSVGKASVAQTVDGEASSVGCGGQDGSSYKRRGLRDHVDG